MSDTPVLPEHIESTVSAIAELRRQHERTATPSQRLVLQSTAMAGRPRFVGWLTVVLVLWIAGNGFAKLAGASPPDPPPFSYVQAATGVLSVYVALLILITQRHENKLAEARDQLTLELTILNEQKSAKIISLLEEMRRDLPGLPNRPDIEAEELGKPADPQAVHQALQATTAELEETLRGDTAVPVGEEDD